MIVFELVDKFKDLFACRGRYGCGATVLGVDRKRHAQFHAQHGDPVDLSDLDGANDPGPMPPRS